MLSVVVMSCDAYEDIHRSFYTKRKIWGNCPYETYLITETKDSEYAKTIKTQGEWTARLRQALEKIDTEYVLFMLDDFFIREYVDQERIDKVLNSFQSDIATFNFERAFDTECKKKQ